MQNLPFSFGKVFCNMIITGIYKAVKGDEWLGGESRKIDYWDRAGAVEGIAETGIDLKNSRITVKTNQSNGKSLVQICLVSDDIYTKIMEASVWNPK